MGPEAFRRMTLLAAETMKSRLPRGASAIDATAGTGEDTCVLAECVGKNGRVYAFDIQTKALEQTALKLSAKGLLGQSCLYCTGHEKMAEIPEIRADKRILGVVFNLGYLPGGNQGIYTRKETTLPAVKAALDLLAVGGVMTLCLYPHTEGVEEGLGVEDFCRGLGRGYYVHRIETINKKNPPWLIIVEKTK